MADETVELAAEVVGADAAVRELSRVRGAAQQVERQGASQAAAATSQARTIVQSQTQVGAAVTAAGGKWGQLAGALGNVGAVVGNVSPQFGHLGTIMGQVGSASGALTGALGPVGVGIAAVTTAIGIAIPLIEAMGDESDSTAGDMRTMERAAKQASEEIRGLIQAMREQRAQERVAGGTASDSDLEGRSGTLQQRLERQQAQVELANRNVDQLRQENRRLESQMGSDGGLNAIRRARIVENEREINEALQSRAQIQERLNRSLEEQTQIVQEQLNRGLEDDAAAQAELEAREAERSSQRRRGGRNTEGQEMERWLGQWRTRLDQMEQDAAAAATRSMLDEMRERGEASVRQEQQTQDAINQIRQWSRDRDKQLAEERVAEAERVAERTKQIAQESAAEMRELNSMMITDSLAPATDLAGELFGFLIDGADLSGDAFLRMLDSFLESTAIQYTIKALAEGAEAAAAAARYDYASAVQHGVAAALAGAVAVATGVAGAAISVPPAPTGGGDSSGPAPVGVAGAGGGNVTVNLFAPQAVFTEAERGELIAGAMREGRRQLGPGAVRG